MIPEKPTFLEQRAFMRGYQKFEIRPDGELEVTIKHLSTTALWTHNQFKVPLWRINPSFARVKYMQAGSFIGAVIFGLASAGMLYGIITARDSGMRWGLSIPLFFFFLLFWACFWKLQTMSVNANIFHFRDGEGQLHIWYGKPDMKSFEEFSETLKLRAEQAWSSRPIQPDTQSLAGELAALKKLKDNGVLNDAEFERAKAKLLEQNEKRTIGFK